MPVQFACSCGKTLRVPDNLIGKKIKCPNCGTVQLVEGDACSPAAEEAEKEPLPEKETFADETGAEEAAVPSGGMAKDEVDEKEDRPREPSKEGPLLLQGNTFVVKEQGKMFSSEKTYDILDGETGELLGSVRLKSVGLFGLLLGKDRGPATMEVRSKDNELVFAVRRRGLIFKKIEAVDAGGQVLGLYKAKFLSLSGGYHVYDHKGKHYAEIRGKGNYRILTPSGVEMGEVSRKWGGFMRELFSSAGTYGVRVGEEYGDDTAKMLILGAALAINALFPKKKKKGGGDSEGDDSEAEEPKAKEES
jgi:uncharacterized protein YxjI